MPEKYYITYVLDKPHLWMGSVVVEVMIGGPKGVLHEYMWFDDFHEAAKVNAGVEVFKNFDELEGKFTFGLCKK